MTIEASQYINQLNSNFPRSTDLLKEGDDHIRMIKANLKNTFPNFNGSVKWTSDGLNNLADNINPSATGMSFTKAVTLAANTGINAGGNKITNVAKPAASADVVTVEYLLKEFGNRIFPIGSIYTTTGGEDPKNIWGGTWQVVAQGRYIMGAGTGGSSGWQIGNTSTGGSTSFSIGVNNLPAHGHVVPEHGHGGWIDEGGYHRHTLPNKNNSSGGNGAEWIRADSFGDGGGVTNNARTNDGGQHTHGLHINNQGAFWTQNTGSGQGISYIPAYYGMTFWRRTGLA